MDFSWTHWKFAPGFGVYDPIQGDCNYAILNALLPWPNGPTPSSDFKRSRYPLL
ncbi:MAG: hypothetical protein JXA30_07560 [Deltaproteobacteria bacterium]|nr:hypothetical protein [Deltaproteobacteria bacterium]